MKNESIIYPGQNVCILGLGVTGRAAVRYCLEKGARVRVSDSRTKEQFLHDEGEFIGACSLECEAGSHSIGFLEKSDILLPSPGVDLNRGVVGQLRNGGMPIAGELAVVAAELRVPVVAVTGTNGKTTVTTLIGEVLGKSGKRVFVGGNIGTPLYEYCLSPDGYDVLVVEVSSFQLECCGNFSPDVAVLLNITPDHLDRHPSMEAYISAKANIFRGMKSGGVAVINGDDPMCRKVALPLDVESQTFGVTEGCTLQVESGQFSVAADQGGRENFAHGLENIEGFLAGNYAAAFLALKKLGLLDADIKKGLQEFRALPHRIEFVEKVRGVTFINDSKATNTGAVIGALTRFEGGVILIAGGRDKGEDYALLRVSVKTKVKTLVLIGEAADQIQASLCDLTCCVRAATMEEAVRMAFQGAEVGDTVLLSPACASFDMFKSYGDRGNRFRTAVLKLARENMVTEDR